MTIEKLREVVRHQPFRPFQINLADGRSIRVPHGEFLAMSPSGRTVIVYQADDSFEIVELLLVTTLEVEKSPVDTSSNCS